MSSEECRGELENDSDECQTLSKIKAASPDRDRINKSEESLKDHDALCKATDRALQDLLAKDPLLSDLPCDITPEEIEAQISVLNGRAITIYIEREGLAAIKVPQSRCKVQGLKKAIIERIRKVSHQSLDRAKGKSSAPATSWRYVWRTYFLVNENEALTNDNQSLLSYGVGFEEGDNSVVRITARGLELTQAVILQRQEYLQKMCEIMDYGGRSIKELGEAQMEHMLVDKKHKILYCYVPKVACTNWKRILMILTGKWNGTDPLRIPASQAHSVGMFEKLNSMTLADREVVLSEYTKLILVRHPFERLLSAYRNKLEGNSSSAKYFQKRVGKLIIKNLRVRPSNESLENGHDVLFSEFIQYLLTPNLSLSYDTYNEHWEPASKLCHPCIIKYNVIGKYETLLDDSALALHLINAGNVTFPTGYRTSGTNSYLQKYFDPIPIGVARRLYEVYQDDFKLFDYDLEDVLGFDFG